MYVCLCRGVTERCVRRAIAAGAHDVAAIGRSCRAGTRCGGCHELVEAMLLAAGVDPADRSGPGGPAPVPGMEVCAPVG